MRSFGTIRKRDTRFVPECSSFHGTRNPLRRGSEDRASHASRLCPPQAGVANLKVAGHQPLLNNALERLLGKGRPQIIQVAKDTLGGNLRGVLSQLTPEEVNQDKLRFAEKLLEEAEHDLASRLALIEADGAIARADMEKRQAEARGKAAKIVEDGRATAAVLTQMIEIWKAAGPNARDIFLMQKLQTVMSSLVETIQSVKVDRISYLPANARVAQGIQLVEQVKTAFGVDLAKVVARLGAPKERGAGEGLKARQGLRAPACSTGAAEG